MTKIAYDYSHVNLTPNYSTTRHRSEDCDPKIGVGCQRYRLPVIPANMAAVINADIASWLASKGYFYIMHRFGDTKLFLSRALTNNWKTISISVGVTDKDKSLVRWAAKERIYIDVVTVDIAHGHSIWTKEMIAYVKKYLPNTLVIAGNVATPHAVNELASWGADIAKVGIGGGGACSTKNTTGFHMPMFTCVQECANLRIPIIADGGVREDADFSKALVAGASMVMAGSVFSACTDAPGESIYCGKNKTVVTHKKYWGSASSKQKGEHKHVEGKEILLECNGMSYAEKYQDITEHLQSAISYAGGKDLSAFKRVDYTTTK